MSTRRNLIARLRNNLKEVAADTQFTNRYLWYSLWSVAKVLVKREAEHRRLYHSNNSWTTICVDMEPVSPILCDCLSLPLDCVIYRSRYPLPKFLETSQGAIHRFIASADLSEHLILTSPFQYSVNTKLRFKKERFVFIHNDYLWSPDVTWPKIMISGIFSEIDSSNNCLPESETGCPSILELESGIPDYLEYDVIDLATQKLLTPKQITKDEHPNTNSSQLHASQ